MTTKDKLTDEALILIIDQLSRGNHRASLIEDAEKAARELLAHRRASQAAPAPSDALREENARDKDARKLIAGFMLDCNAIGLGGASENLVKSIKEQCAKYAAADAALSTPTEERQ